eukprot:m51a1_g14369 hypothetical protein (250) ;mRNA; r:250499-252349
MASTAQGQAPLDRMETAGRVALLANSAVAHDARGEYAEALDLYTQAVALLLRLLDAEDDAPRRQLLRDKVLEYVTRAEALKAHVRGGGSGAAHVEPSLAFPAVPVAPGAPPSTACAAPAAPAYPAAAAAPPAAAPSRPVAEQVGAALAATYQKAQELNREYKVQERVGAAVASGVAKAQELDREYHLQERAATALKSGAEAVYSFVSQVASSAVSSYQSSQQLPPQQQQQQQQQDKNEVPPPSYYPCNN